MNCTVCSKPIDSHVEGRGTDRCVAEKLGWKFDQPIPSHWKCDSEEAALNENGDICCVTCQPPDEYSSPDMIPETWQLTNKWRNFYLIKVNPEPIEKWEFRESVFRHGDGYPVYYVPTAPLAICRAFLAQKEGE